ncbi:hypothetical protein [uncultured Lentibacter sp.]|uniref:hypothetical protein n=1 Tax=uncultured Lentibacter sp. TaxID=1659309 RepID=UPI00261175B2|nr:hypothetical protein [uncultured Lentibacter sp.]
MKPTYLALAAALLLGAAFTGRALWQTAHPPAPAAAYVALFETHCLTRLTARQSGGADPYADLPENAQRITRLDAAGLQAIQRRHSCTVKDATRLMTETQRDAAVANILELLTTKLPDLRETPDPRPWDLHRSFIGAPAPQKPQDWGVTLSRQKPASGDSKQMTLTRLTLPRP